MNRDAAVAVIRLISQESATEPHFLILRRAQNPHDPWSGHFAFPGGRREPGDFDLFAACHRETFEECGIDLTTAIFVDTLPLTEAGNALGHPVAVTPYLFELTAHPEVTLDATECAAFHWVPESQLRSQTHQTQITPIPGSDRRFPAVALDDGHIWGFTYKVLADLLDLPRQD